MATATASVGVRNESAVTLAMRGVSDVGYAPVSDNSCWGSADYTRHKVSTLHGNLSHELVVDCFCHELSLCAASRMWVRHRSVLIIPPEGGLQSRWES